MNQRELDNTADTIRQHFENVNEARNLAYDRSRSLISLCARAIRAVHRDEWETAETLIAEAREAAHTLTKDVSDYPALYFTGYTQDAIKEFVEASLTYALVRHRPWPAQKNWGLKTTPGSMDWLRQPPNCAGEFWTSFAMVTATKLNICLAPWNRSTAFSSPLISMTASLADCAVARIRCALSWNGRAVTSRRVFDKQNWNPHCMRWKRGSAILRSE